MSSENVLRAILKLVKERHIVALLFNMAFYNMKNFALELVGVNRLLFLRKDRFIDI